MCSQYDAHCDEAYNIAVYVSDSPPSPTLPLSASFYTPQTPHVTSNCTLSFLLAIITCCLNYRKQKVAKASQRTFVYYAGALAVCLVLWYGGVKVIDGKMTSGALLTFVLYGMQVRTISPPI